MKKSAILLLFILVLSAAASAFSNVPTPNKSKEFALKDMSGNAVSLNSYKGKVVLLAFFQTECPPCQEEIPQLEPIYQKYRSKNFDVIAVSMKENANIVRLFAGKNNLSFHVLLDEEGSVAAAYNVRFIPRIFILDRTGKIVFNSYYISAEDLEKEIIRTLR
jgi:peroxiredoxin